jgi:hypothetical protein
MNNLRPPFTRNYIVIRCIIARDLVSIEASISNFTPKLPPDAFACGLTLCVHPI